MVRNDSESCLWTREAVSVALAIVNRLNDKLESRMHLNLSKIYGQLLSRFNLASIKQEIDFNKSINLRLMRATTEDLNALNEHCLNRRIQP